MIKSIKYIAISLIITVALAISAYESASFFVRKYEKEIKVSLSSRLPQSFKYQKLRIEASILQGLRVYFDDVDIIKNEDVKAHIGSISLKLDIANTLLQRKAVISSLEIDDTVATVDVNALGALDSGYDVISLPSTYFKNIELQLKGEATIFADSIFISSNLFSRAYTVKISNGNQRLDIKLFSKDIDRGSIGVEVETNRLQLSNWLRFSNSSSNYEVDLNNVELEFDYNFKINKFGKTKLKATGLFRSSNESENEVRFKDFNININEDGSYKLGSIENELAFLKTYNKSIKLDKVVGEGYLDNNYIKISSLQFKTPSFDYPRLKGEIRCAEQSIFDCKAELQFVDTNIPIVLAKDWIPGQILPDLESWLKESLLAGNITSSVLEIDSAGYSWKADFSDVNLKYDNNWDILYNLYGQLNLTHDYITIDIDAGETYGGKLSDLKAKINFSDDYNLNISSRIEMGLFDVFDFLERSPLNNNVNSSFPIRDVTGFARLNLGLDIPLQGDTPVKANGILDVTQGGISLGGEQYKIKIDDINTALNFEQDKIRTSKLNFSLWDEPAKGMISSEMGDKEVKISFASTIKAKDIIDLIPEAKEFKLSGRTKLNAALYLNNHEEDGQVKIVLDSKLKGIKFNFSNIVFKETNDERSLNLSYTNGVNTTLDLDIHKSMQARLLYDDGLWGGHIDFGQKPDADPGDKKNIFISGTVDGFDISKFDLSYNRGYLAPVKLYMMIKKLDIYGAIFDEVWVSYNEGYDEVSLEGPNIAGKIIWESDYQVKLDFKNLSLQKLPSVKGNNDVGNIINNFQGIDFVCENFSYNNNILGKLNISAIYKDKGFDIFSALSHESSQLQMQGRWLYPGQKKQVSEISGNWSTKNFGNLMSLLGVNKDLYGGEGNISTFLSWPGAIYDFNKENLQGELNLQMKNGIITAVDPGFGKLLGLLSLDQITKRLKLDFSDVLNKGLSYDSLLTDVNISSGVAHITNIFVDSPSAKISISGNMALVSQKLDLVMDIAPKVTETLPVAAAVAVGNPAVGAAFWVVDKVIGNKMSQSPPYRYWVGGTLPNPIITRDEKIGTIPKPKSR